MKLSQLRQIIREEYNNLMTEGFADPEIRKLAQMKGLDRGRWSNFFRSFANTHDIAWDQLPKGTLTKTTNFNDPLVKKGLAFWMIDAQKENPYRGSSWMNSSILYPGVLAVTLNGKIQYMSRGEVSGKGGRGTEPQAAVGQAGHGMLQVKKLKDMADSLLVMNFESFRGGTTALKAKRAELKLGKDTFTDHRAWKQANLKRYKDILDARVGSRDQVDRMVGQIVKIANEAVAEGMSVVKMGKYGRLMTTINGNEVELENVTNAMGRALQYYANYIRYANNAEKDKEAGYESRYYDKESKAVAGTIKKILNAFKAGDGNNINRY